MKDIKERNIPNKEEKKQIKNVQQNIKQLMEYFKINQKGFEETKNYGSNRKQKVLVKEINGIKVYNNIKYM